MSFSSGYPQSILFLATNPEDTICLQLERELRDIGEGLQRAQKRDQFQLEQRLAVRPRDIQRAMLDISPQIIHFSGHGTGARAAIEFAVGFYDAIGAGRLIEFAYKLGRAAIRMAGIAEHLTPVLLKKST
ncbi:hypothetical protein [Scytonema sp. NUACC26]|uniref:hypothetical protein n=1 Tax=Scytonema sp. NUACC26 TaxID=3140176 RepID=UPI0034DC59B2